jgi:hypothetical protein
LDLLQAIFPQKMLSPQKNLVFDIEEISYVVLIDCQDIFEEKKT